MTADRAAPGERGRAMGTLYTAWELGMSGGSMLLGLCATTLGYAATWGTAAARGAGRARRALADRETARLTVVGPSPGGPGRPRQRGVPRSPPAVRRTRGAGGLWTALVDTS